MNLKFILNFNIRKFIEFSLYCKLDCIDFSLFLQYKNVEVRNVIVIRTVFIDVHC